MPKEILEAVDLQPQYRTFSEIRDYMLQQARQRADAFVGDVCHSTKKIGNVTSRANTNTPTTIKTTTPIPIDFSQIFSNAFKNETVDQESDLHPYEEDPEGDGDELYAVKGKGKGGFKGTCFKCGMISMLAERKGQRRQGRLEDRRMWTKRKRMVQGEMVKLWSRMGQFLSQFQFARQNVWSRGGSVGSC